MEAHKISAKAVAEQLGVRTGTGLDNAGVAASKEKFGLNTLTPPKKENILHKAFTNLTEPMMLILLFAFGLTVTTNIIKYARGESFDIPECVGIFVAIVISVAITLIMERRSEKAFLALGNLSANTTVKALRNGKIHNLPATEIVVGDILKFVVGDKIPVDCRLLTADGFETDESPLTGESNPVLKNAEFIFSADENPPLAERVNTVYGGCFVTAGTAVAIVTAVGDQTEIGDIARGLKDTPESFTPLQQKLSALGKTVAFLGAVAAVFVFAVQIIQLIVLKKVSFDSVQSIFITSIVLIVAAVPEGLPTIVAVSFALNVIKMAKENALVKKMAACETVGSVSIICSDKTGTLTENKMAVSAFFTRSGKISPESLADARLIQNICVNSTADITPDEKTGRYVFIGSPTECALLAAYDKTKPAKSYAAVRAGTSAVYAYPFSSELKRMTTLVRENGRLLVLCKGAPEAVLDLCETDAAQKRKILDEIAAYQKDAKRVIAFAHGFAEPRSNANRTHYENELVFDGFAVIADPIRKDVYAAVAACKRAGVGIKMLTGDNAETAAAVARELKIVSGNAGVFTAREIAGMSDAELKRHLDEIKIVARSTPATKLRIVKALKETDEVVAVTGDGVNDAPAVKAADVGIAMGVTGTEVCKAAADIVVLNDSFASIVTSIRWGRGIYENFQRFILFQLTVNLSAVLVTVVCTLAGLGSPFNALQLLWINIIMDGPPALTLGLEPVYEGLLDKKPVKRGASIITKTMGYRILVNGIFIAAILVLQGLTNFMGVSAEKEKTFVFTLFIVFQLFNAFNARELGRESIVRTFARNKLMLVAMLVTFCAQALIVQVGGNVFGTVPLGWIDWLKIVATGASIIVFNEVYKAIYKTVKNKNKTPHTAASRT